jgi:hypothetical protein
MKNISLILTVVLIIFVGNISFAQESVPKEVLLNTLNGVNKLKISNLKTSQLMEYNTSFVDRVYEIIDSDKTKNDKKSAFKVLNADTEKDLIDLLGKKNYKKYKKIMDEELEPLVKKSKELKYLY